MQESAPRLARIRNSSRVVCRALFSAAEYALAAALLAQPVAAQDRPITLHLNASITWDANVYRVSDSAPDPQAAQGIPGKSDRSSATTLGLNFDKAYAQQHFQLEVSKTDKHYDKFSSLDTDAFEYHGAWLWTLSPRISGTLNASRAESQIPFTDLTIAEQNIRITENRAFKLDGWMFGGWHFVAGVSNADVKTSQFFQSQPGYDSNFGELGIKYLVSSGNSIAAITRSSRGTINNQGQPIDPALFIPSEYKMHENELSTTWRMSGKSTLNGRLARFDRRSEGVPQRDFAGTTGELDYSWAVSGRLQYNFLASRTMLPWTADTQASYRVDDRFSFTPSLQISERVAARLAVYRLVSDFRGPIAPLTGPARHETLRSLLVAVDWSPPIGNHNLRLTGSVQRDRRSSNAGFDFDDNIAMLIASLTF